MSDHPYTSLPDDRFWLRTVASGGMFELDPVGTAPWTIDESTRVVTLGSCFAQHIARHLQTTGLAYLVTEPGPESLSEAERARRQYGAFSARYGNVYTVSQAADLVQRAKGILESSQELWHFGSAVVDPHRPTVEPDGFPTFEAMIEDRERHLAATRDALATADIVVFTLGLTEGWCERDSGLALPLAPGVHGGEFAAAQHVFANCTYDECRTDLDRFLDAVRALNPTVRFILTVSPVPLAATYEPRHVLASTGASKAILRAVADEASRRDDDVFYFPSYDLITAPGYSGIYFNDDLRSVNELGVAHVMRAFDRAFREIGTRATGSHHEFAASDCVREAASRIICDEERLA